MVRLPPRSTRPDTLFPYTTLFRSDDAIQSGHRPAAGLARSANSAKPAPHETAFLSGRWLGFDATRRDRRVPAVAAAVAVRHPCRLLLRALVAAARGLAADAPPFRASYPTLSQ